MALYKYFQRENQKGTCKSDVLALMSGYWLENERANKSSQDCSSSQRKGKKSSQVCAIKAEEASRESREREGMSIAQEHMT